MVIQHNIPSINLHRNHTSHQKKIAKSLERLSTGYKINRAADDPAGLAISEKMRSQIRSLQSQLDMARQGISDLKSLESGLLHSQELMQRMYELAVKASNGTYTDEDRELLNVEFQELKDALRGSYVPSYGGLGGMVTNLGGAKGDQSLRHLGISGIDASEGLSGELSLELLLEQNDQGIAILQIGDEQYQARLDGSGTTVFQLADGESITISFQPGELQGGLLTDLFVQEGVTDLTNAMGYNDLDRLLERVTNEFGEETVRLADFGVGGLDISTQEGAKDAMESVKQSLRQISRACAAIGGQINTMEERITFMENQLENLIASESTIRDADMAQEMVEFIKYTILAEATQLLMAQANAHQRTFVDLLKSMG